jgi:cytochrome c oxidase subunit IV
MSHPSTDHGHADDGAVHAHVSSTFFYVAIFSALVFLTILTVGLSYVHLGPANLAIAVVIASIKAALVVLFFMHLRWDSKFNALIFICSLGFIGIFFAYTFSDTGWRDKQYNEAQGARVLPNDGKPAPGGMPPREVKASHGASKGGADKHGAGAGSGAAGGPPAPPQATTPSPGVKQPSVGAPH